MILLARSEHILNCSSETLYSYVTNMENYHHWFPGVVDITSSNHKPHGEVGKEYREILALPTGQVSLFIRVKEAEPNRLYITEGDLEPMLPMMTMVFQDAPDNRCHFSLAYHSRSTELGENDPVIHELKANLQQRIVVAMENLSNVMQSAAPQNT